MDIFPWMKGFGSEGAVVNLLFNAFLAAFIAYHFYFKPRKMRKQGNDRRKPGNPNSKPGNADVCKKNKEKITRLDERVKNIEGDIKEIKENNREDHEKIFDKIDKINRR